jgi:ankyrin repeat protein
LSLQQKETPLHWACSGGNTDVIQILLDAGARSFFMTTNQPFFYPIFGPQADGKVLDYHDLMSKALITAVLLVPVLARGHLCKHQCLIVLCVVFLAKER